MKTINLMKLLHRIFYPGGSVRVEDTGTIERFTNDPDFPFLISFPRTGSHWLRALLELYFKKPTLVRSFYYKHSSDYLLYHTHDIELDTNRRNVIYLYRDLVPTIYSQMKYYDTVLQDEKSILKWATIYGKHLSKWLVDETVTRKKTILKYERLNSEMVIELGKAITHLGGSIDENRIKLVANRVTRDEIARKTKHDKKVIDKSSSYEDNRERFSKNYSDLIQNTVFQVNNKLEPYF